MIPPVPHIAEMAPYGLADTGGKNTISLAQNESAFPVSPAALTAGRKALDDLPLYPDPDWTDLRAAIARIHDLDTANILCGTGSMELIGALIRAYAGAGDRVLGTEYGYAFVATATAQAQADIVRAREIDLTISVEDILDAVTPETRIVFVCNPGNPTGTFIANSEIVRLRAALSKNVLLAVDQAYGEFADAGSQAIFDLVDRGDIVVLRTFSKAYGLAGARVGWGYFPADIAGHIRKLLNPNNVSAVSQAVATVAVCDQDHMKNVVARTAKIRDRFIEDLRTLGLTVPQSQTNFVLIRFKSAEAAATADMALRNNNLLLRGMGGYGLADCLRATICRQDVTDKVLSILKGAV